ncbi:uncharacterized protein MONBRDRAFT_1048, partial [Monosiga brevicollis MX1]
KRELERAMRAADTYQEWEAAALLLDEQEKRDLWRLDPVSSLFDADRIAARLMRLHDARHSDDINEAMVQLRENLFRNIGGLGQEQLYSYCHVGTKVIIQQYLQELSATIEHIVMAPTVPLHVKERFLSDARQAYGRTAIMLSGGAAMGMLHWGVLRCLFQNGLLPPVICGNSIGALYSAVLGIHTDDELNSLFDRPDAIDFSAFLKLGKGSVRRKVIRLLKHGVLMDITKLEEFCRANLGDLTFAEAYQRTGRIVNITLTHTTHQGYPHLLNYLTTPNVVLWSAACAACAQPGMYAPVALMAKDIKGNIVPLLEVDPEASWGVSSTIHNPLLPKQRLSELFNVNHFIVSQVNPHVVPFLRSMRSSSRFALLHKAVMVAGGELMHRLRQLASIGYWPGLLNWLKSELLQTHEGDVTIVPSLSWATMSNALSNPTPELVSWFAREGEKSTYPYIPIVAARCHVEVALHAGLRRI